jgi:hypothetical protein
MRAGHRRLLPSRDGHAKCSMGPLESSLPGARLRLSLGRPLRMSAKTRRPTAPLAGRGNGELVLAACDTSRCGGSPGQPGPLAPRRPSRSHCGPEDGSLLAAHVANAEDIVVRDHFHLECTAASRRLELRNEWIPETRVWRSRDRTAVLRRWSRTTSLGMTPRLWMDNRLSPVRSPVPCLSIYIDVFVLVE